jgi:hypothetical protein
MGFTFDDAAAAKGEAESVAEMRRLIQTNPSNAERIKPYIGGEEVNNSPTYSHYRFAIDFEDFPLRRDPALTRPWNQLGQEIRSAMLRSGIVSAESSLKIGIPWVTDRFHQHRPPRRDSAMSVPIAPVAARRGPSGGSISLRPDIGRPDHRSAGDRGAALGSDQRKCGHPGRLVGPLMLTPSRR